MLRLLKHEVANYFENMGYIHIYNHLTNQLINQGEHRDVHKSINNLQKQSNIFKGKFKRRDSRT